MSRAIWASVRDRCGVDQIPLVLAVLVIHDNDTLAAAQ
jgi:hypothetical protein